jgi:NmrA-like family
VTIGIDAIISVVGSLALATQIGYIDAAVEAGVKRFIPSEFGCDTQAPYLFHPKRVANNSQEEMIFAQKRGVAAYLKELSDLNKITYTLISTGTLPSDGLRVRSLFHIRSSVSCSWD